MSALLIYPNALRQLLPAGGADAAETRLTTASGLSTGWGTDGPKVAMTPTQDERSGLLGLAQNSVRD